MKKFLLTILIIIILIFGFVFIQNASFKITFIGKVPDDSSQIICSVNAGIFGKEIKASDFYFINNGNVYNATHVAEYESIYYTFDVYVTGNKKIIVSFATSSFDLSTKTIYYKNKEIRK